MHELSIAQSIVEAVCERVGAQGRVTRVFLEVGRLSCVEPHAIAFCFEVCAQGTCVEGAALECVEVDGRARCRRCGGEVPAETAAAALATCACGSSEFDVTEGERLRVAGVEVL